MTSPKHVSVPVEPTEEMMKAGLDGWRPIESAPTDGTIVLVCTFDDNNFVWYPLSAKLNEGEWCADFGPAWRPFSPQPTHWRPMPEPPHHPEKEGVVRIRTKSAPVTDFNLYTSPPDTREDGEPFTPGKRSTGPGHVQRGGTG